MARVLVTGGAGFIGSHLVDALIARGHSVRVFDSLEPQVHGPGAARPDYLHPQAELVVGQMTDRAALTAALQDVEVIFHITSRPGSWGGGRRCRRSYSTEAATPEQRRAGSIPGAPPLFSTSRLGGYAAPRYRGSAPLHSPRAGAARQPGGRYHT